MKNCCLLLLFGLLCVSLKAQQRNFTINWSGHRTLETSSNTLVLPAFDSDHYNYTFENGIRFFAEWKNPQKVNESDFEVTNLSYSAISKIELKDLPLSLIPKKHNLKLSNSTDRGKNFVHLSIAPIIKDASGYKKLNSFTIIYKSQNNNARQRLNPAPEITDSNLADGNWYRFTVDQTGVHRIGRDFLSRLGVDVGNTDPRNIGVYGHGGSMLPYLNSENEIFDMVENSIQFVGEEDGSIDDQDYILFYAEGPTGYNEESNTNINIYTNTVYYYIKVGNKNGKRIGQMEQPQSEADLSVNTFQDYQFLESDQFNLVKVGRRWFGNRFDVENTQTFSFNFPNLINSEPALVKVYTAAVSDVTTNMSVSLNGDEIRNLRFSAANDPVLASGASYIGQQAVSSDELEFTLTYNNNGNPSSLGYLDYISVEATRALTYVDEQFIFKNEEANSAFGTVEYNISNASDVSAVWDISDQFNIKKVENTNAESTFSFKDRAARDKEYLALTTRDYFEPNIEGNTAVLNQNLKGTIFRNSRGEFEDIDYIILTPRIFSSQAERLAKINRKEYGLTVKVVDLESIYLEFSSGQQDIAGIRNFVRYVYTNASSDQERLKYLCMFGDASYDYKDRISGNTNLVPSWHAYSSFSLTSSFISDDFFGMMDENEGDMSNADKLDIAVGRILADDLERARVLVDKIEQYYAPESYGNWRNNYVVVSDDVDFAYEEVLQKTTNDIGNEVTDNKPYINAVKIHSDAFEQESSASGERYPAVTEAMKDAIAVGAIAINYFGHGGEDGLALERIFDKNDAQELSNICKYNLFVTVTCEYTRFDNPQRPTAGEFTYWNKKGGAIGLITTTRQIFVTVGTAFNVVMEKYLFSYNPNVEYSIGEALRQTKNDVGIAGLSQKRLVFCIGDPAMKLAIPQPDIRLTTVNGDPLGSQNNVLKALDKVSLGGEVTDASGNVMESFNGVLTATIFDKPIDRSTLANDGTTDNQGNLIILDFETLGEIIFNGQATVTNGKFNFEFIVPRDIGVNVGTGKANFYAKEDNKLNDMAGANFDIRIGGINENAEEDNVGPIVGLFMNDENFVSGGITNEAPTLIAKLSDEHGINTASGIGHDITAILDGDETNPFILNDYYEAEVDDFTKGTVTFPFRDLENGIHTLTLKAWDTYNNSSVTEIQFEVFDEDEQLVIENVLNYPNPFVDYTEFWFNHNSSDVLDVSIQIFTVSGKLVRTLNGQTAATGKTTGSLSKDIVWDGRDDFGDRIGKGVYVYKLKVRSNSLNRQVEKVEKLVIL